MDPISMATFLFKGALGLITIIMRKDTLKKLKEGEMNVADQNIRMLILAEVDKVSFKLDSQSRISLKTSKSYYKDGLGYLNEVLTEVLNDKTIEQKDTETTQTTKPPGGIGQSTFYSDKRDAAKDVKCLKGADLNKSSVENLKKARKSFEKASDEARRACQDPNLKAAERLEAMYIRIMATILESVENPSHIKIPCQNCLKEMRDIREIKDIFEGVLGTRKMSKQDVNILMGVCHLYRVIHDVTQLSHQCSGPWTWPCIKIEGKKTSQKIDPLRDVRVAEALCQLQMVKGETVLTKIADMPVVWPFGSANDGKLISPRYIATNTKGQFIVLDDGDRTIKVFDENGRFMKFNSFRPLCSHLADEDILSVVTDQEDNIFVLIKIDKYRHEVCVFNKHVQFSHKFPLSEGVVRCLPIINDNNQVLVGVEQKDQNSFTMEVYTSSGMVVNSFKQEILKKPKDMTIDNEGRLMVLDGPKRVVVFDTGGKHMPELDFDHEGVPSEAIAFHSESKHVVVSNLEPGGRVKMSIYNEKREWVSSIYQGERKVMEETECVPPKIAVTKDGRIAILAGIVGESKVIVV